jgi:rhodanese-related sulfurtransferase
VKTTIVRALVIVAAGAALGLGGNALGGRGLPLTAHAYMEPGDQAIPPAEAKARFDKGALFLDARPKAFYDMAHVPGALALPEDDFDRAFSGLEPRLRQSLDVVVYCSGFGCEASHIVARKLKDRGIPAVVLADGWPAWTDAGYPTKDGPQP